MTVSGISARGALAMLALSLGACHSASVFKGAGYSDPRLSERIDKAYEIRDACLARHAAAAVNGVSDPSSVANSVVISCMTETDQLIAVINPWQDPKVTTSILKDNDSKALRYVRLARGERTT